MTKNRQQHFEQLQQQLIADGYVAEKNTLSAAKGNIFGFLITLPIIIPLIFLYQRKYGYAFQIFDEIRSLLLLFTLFIFSIFIHEFLHGITWANQCKNGWQSIKFGVLWRSFTPYCHCKEILSYRSYVLGGAMPFLILGLFVTIIGFLIGHNIVFWFGISSILAAGGDLLILYMLRRHKQGWIVDHPSEIGYVAFLK